MDIFVFFIFQATILATGTYRLTILLKKKTIAHVFSPNKTVVSIKSKIVASNVHVRHCEPSTNARTSVMTDDVIVRARRFLLYHITTCTDLCRHAISLCQVVNIYDNRNFAEDVSVLIAEAVHDHAKHSRKN